MEAAPVVLDPAKAAGFPKGWVVSDRAALEWSDDNKRVFFGAKAQVPAPDTGARKTTDEQANVDIWNTADERIQSVQMIRAEQDRNFTFREAFDVAGGEVREAGRRDDARSRRGAGRPVGGRPRHAAATSTTTSAPPPTSTASTPPPASATLMLKNQLINTSTGSHTFGISPDGHYFLYWKDNKFQAYDLDAASTRTLGGATTASFVDTEFDHPGPEAGLRHRRLHHRQEVGHRPAPVRSVAAAARRLGGAQPDQRRRARRARSVSATSAPSRSIRPGRRPAAAGGGGGFGGRGGGGAARARRSISPSRSRCRPTARTPRRPASTSSPTAS